jgi:phage terminase small subunit|nr:MAG TPA: Terminase small subunit [Caudoviricetes sp.]
MTDTQKRFCDEYLIDLNATRAYKVAYPRCKKDETANAASSRMLRNVKVQEYISKKQQEIEKRTEVTQDMVIKELAAIAFSKASDYAKLKKMKRNVPVFDGEDIVDYKEEEYTGIEFTPTDELTEEQKKALSGIKEGKFGIQVDSCDKVKALELLGKHLGMFKEKVTIDGNVNTNNPFSGMSIEELRKILNE